MTEMNRYTKELRDRFFDKDFRKELLETPKKGAKDLGYDYNVDFSVVINSKNRIFVVIPTRKTSIPAAELANISAAGAMSLGSIGSIGSVCTTAGTVGTASSANIIKTEKYGTYDASGHDVKEI